METCSEVLDKETNVVNLLPYGRRLHLAYRCAFLLVVCAVPCSSADTSALQNMFQNKQ